MVRRIRRGVAGPESYIYPEGGSVMIRRIRKRRLQILKDVQEPTRVVRRVATGPAASAYPEGEDGLGPGLQARRNGSEPVTKASPRGQRVSSGSPAWRRSQRWRAVGVAQHGLERERRPAVGVRVRRQCGSTQQQKQQRLQRQRSTRHARHEAQPALHAAQLLLLRLLAPNAAGDTECYCLVPPL
jgi:hypothetical protein